MALKQFLLYHFDGSASKLRIFLEQPADIPDDVDAERLADLALAEAVPELVE
jgi:hypothetical protein